MVNKKRRTQVLFTEKQYKKLHEISEKNKRSVGFLIREAIDTVYLNKKQNKKEIVERISKMELPVAEWEDIKEQILNDKGKYGGNV